MNITHEMLKQPNSSPEINQEAIDKEEAKILRYFHKLGYSDTELSKKLIMRLAATKAAQDVDATRLTRTGVAMIGNIGTGKSVLLKLSAFVLGCQYLDVPSLSIEFSRYGAESFWSKIDNKYGGNVLILDDLGAEQDAKSYGNAVPIAELLYSAYDKWQRNGALLWIASNLTASEMEGRYGARVVDRIKEMCSVIPATGDSLRTR